MSTKIGNERDFVGRLPAGQSRRVVYVSTTPPEWIEVAKSLSEDGIEPVMWMGTREREIPARYFPNIETPDVYEMWQAGWRGLAEASSSLVDYVDNMAELVPHWDSLLSMAARSAWTSLQYFEIRQRIYGLYAFFREYLLRKSIDFVMFQETPHKIGPYLIFVAAKNQGLPTPMFVRTMLPGRIFLTDEIGGLPFDLLDELAEIDDDSAQSLIASHHRVGAELRRLRTGTSEETVPHYMNSSAKLERRARRLFAAPRYPDFWRQLPRRCPGYIRKLWTQLSYPFTEKARRLSELRNAYKQVVVSRPANPFVLVALHYQPERRFIRLKRTSFDAARRVTVGSTLGLGCRRIVFVEF